MTICRDLRIGRTPTTGFVLTSDRYANIGSFQANLSISYPAGANSNIIIVVVGTPDSCVQNATVTLNATGAGNLLYNVTTTQTIYAMVNTGTCCSTFSYPPCLVSNYVQFNIIEMGSIRFLSNPSGAQIWLAPTGQTPTDTGKVTTDTISDLLVGDYDYTLKLTSYNDYISTQPITVIKDQIAIVGPISLVPAEGCIYFISSPQGARIYLASAGQTPVDTGYNTPHIICGKPLGDYIYKLTLAGYEDKTGTVTLTTGHGEIVTQTLRGLPTLSDITISPINPSVAVNTDQQFSATPLDQYGNPIAVTVTWSSSNTYVGTIDQNTGMFSALHIGTSVITASSSSITKTTIVTVTLTVPVLTTIIVSPATASIVANNAVIFTATTLDQLGNPIFSTVIWNSSNPIVGTINQNGVFLALSQGTTIITASSGDVSGIAIANVTSAVPTGQPILTKITIEPLITSILVNNSTIFVASTLDQFGNSTATTVTWSSSDTNIGTIDQNGIFSALNIGKTTITASSGNIFGAALVNVVKTLPGQATGGILGNINTAALILGTAIVGAVISYKGSKEKEIERQVEIAKKEIDKEIEIERIREREIKDLTKK